MLKSSSHSRAGFSLIEVVIAVGIVTFVIVAIIGLLSIGLQNSRESAEDTNLAIMTQTTSAILRSRPFNDVYSNDIYATNSTNAYYFDANGGITRTAEGKPSFNPNADSFYACYITRRTPDEIASRSANFIYMQYKFVWPLNVPASNQNKRIILTSRANYD